MRANVGVGGRDLLLSYAVSLDQFVRHVWRTVCARFRITVCGLHELVGHAEASVSHVLSILDPDWPTPTAFGSYGEHARLELRFHDIIDETSGMLPPTREHVMQLLAFGRRLPAEADGTSWCIAMQACRGRRPRWRCSWHRPCLNALGQTSSGRSCAFGPKFSPTFA